MKVELGCLCESSNKKIKNKLDLHPRNEIAQMSKRGPVYMGCYPHCHSNTAAQCRNMMTKGKEKGRGSEGSCMVLIRLEQVKGDGLEQVVKHADADEKREREKRATVACLSTRPGTGYL